MDLTTAKSASIRLLAYISSMNESGPVLYQPSVAKLQSIGDNCGLVSDIVDSYLSKCTNKKKGIQNISDAVNQSYKLRQFVFDLCSSESSLSSDTTSSLIRLRSICSDIVSSISEVLGSDEDEFDRMSSIQTQLNEIKAMIQNIHKETADGQDTLDDRENTIDDNNTTDESYGSESEEISKVTRRKARSDYNSAMKELSTKRTGIKPVDTCIKLISDWYTTRFLINDKNFHYDMKKIPSWIGGIVLAFNESFAAGTYYEFTTSFNQWLTDVKISGSKYSLPYDIFIRIKNRDKSLCTLHAAVMWDILLDSGFNKISDKQPYQLYLSEDTIYQWISEVDPDTLDDYENYRENPSILDRLGFHKEVNS